MHRPNHDTKQHVLVDQVSGASCAINKSIFLAILAVQLLVLFYK